MNTNENDSIDNFINDKTRVTWNERIEHIICGQCLKKIYIQNTFTKIKIEKTAK